MVEDEPMVSVSADIEATAAELYDMVSDLPRMGEWSPENTGGRWVGGADGPEVGARFRGTNKSGWRFWWTANEVIEAEPGQAFAFRTTSGPLKVSVWRYRFEPSGSGAGTTVTEEWTDLRGAGIKIGGRVVSGVGDRAGHNREGMERTLANLKAAAES